jgi:radical SAM superfamily enzyme YgiQ (UPF0313 family)
MKTFGAHKVAHELRQHGYSVLVVQHVHSMTLEEILKIIDRTVSEQTLFVGVSNTFTGRTASFRKEKNEDLFETFLPQGSDADAAFISTIKNKNSNCKIVLGGARTHNRYRNRSIDYVVIGYADISIVQLANFLQHGTPMTLKQYKNIWGVNLIQDDLADGFDFNGSSMSWCDDDVVIYGESLPLEISRGCVFRCKFCSFRLNGKQSLDYLKCTDTIEKEMIENYNRYGITKYRLLDDTFNDTEEKIDAMLEITNRLPFRPTFGAYIRLDLLAAKPHTIEKLVQIGVKVFYFGIETLNQRAGRIIGKGAPPERLIEVIKNMKKTYGDQIVLQGSFICGLPGESKSDIKNTMSRLLSGEIPLDQVFFSPLAIKKSTNYKWLSPFDLEWQNYGYSEIQESNGADEIILHWKNEHMTYYEAVELTADWFKTYRSRNDQTYLNYDPRNPEIIDTYKQQLFRYIELQ